MAADNTAHGEQQSANNRKPKVKQDHYFSQDQNSLFRLQTVDVLLKDDSFSISTASGLFSKDEVDFGTRLLIENTQPKGLVLDLGCGYGVVGIALLRRHKNLSVIFSDINSRAVEVTKQNLEHLKLKGDIRQSDIFTNIPESFDTILSNPPYAAGRQVCYAMIEGSHAHLNKKGTLYIVARHAKGGKMLEKKMKEVFGNVKTIAKRGGFRVYASER
ncbi:MAG: methyltransferase [Nanoarchaeota archaeon]